LTEYSLEDGDGYSMDDAEHYPLTLDHVKQYLATRHDTDPIGICGNAMWCLLSETLNHHYPQHRPWRVDQYSYGAPGTSRFDLDASILILRKVFDMQRSDSALTTKAYFRHFLIQEYNNIKEVLEIDELPFRLSELF
jgi:hypothetical protein